VIVMGIKCPKCWDCIYSAYGHDFRYCFCGYCFVDGGTWYLRFGWGGDKWPGPIWVKPDTVYIDTDDYVRGGLRS
jgi:hypothetical protein